MNCGFCFTVVFHFDEYVQNGRGAVVGAGVLAVTRLLALVISMLLSWFVGFGCSCVILASSRFVILISHMMLSSFGFIH